MNCPRTCAMFSLIYKGENQSPSETSLHLINLTLKILLYHFLIKYRKFDFFASQIGTISVVLVYVVMFCLVMTECSDAPRTTTQSSKYVFGWM